ncbi:MAG: serine hydrolase domain-containing protein [Acidobacteriota bacterium]|nr:serine hydrolase domain-containing protein [Acidobacteriota bacterium]
MRTRLLSSLAAAALVAAVLAPTAVYTQRRTAVVTAPALPVAAPEAVGFTAGGLDRMDAGMQDIVDKKQLAGVVTLVARKGKVVQHRAYGYQDLDTQTPMRTDTIARIYSMTKPVTGVAMMMLYEEGKWKPTDPIARHIPEFANLRVYAGEKDGASMLEAPGHAPTMGELMSHTAGFTYGLFGNSPVDKLYQAANPLGQPNLKAFINTMATLPLLYQPGTRWVYSVSVDIQGYLVEKLSGQTFPEFLRTRLFDPLGMIDTAFYVPPDKLSRVASIYAYDKAKAALAPAPGESTATSAPGLPSGGGGLYGTAADYFRFAQMLLNGGEFDGKRYLKKATVEMMRTNVLSEQVLNSQSGIGQAQFSPAQGFGYDFAVVLDPSAAKRQVGKGSYWWWGIAGTWFWIDPANEVVFVGIIQRRGGVPGAANHEDVSRRVIAEALAPGE